MKRTHSSTNNNTDDDDDDDDDEIEMIHHDLTGVDNQFLVTGGRTACIPISILSLYHLYKRMQHKAHDKHEQLPVVEEWNELIRRGITLYKVWHAKYVVTDSTVQTPLPMIEEVLALDDCRAFLSLFTDAPAEVSGLVRRTKLAESTEGSLTGLFIRMRKDASRLRQCVCALVVIPVGVCISVLCRPEGANYKECSFLVFDSHGGIETRGASLSCELTQFFMARTTAEYLIKKYGIESLGDIDSECLALCTEEEIVSRYGFHARVFM